MTKLDARQGLVLKDLVKTTGAPRHVIDYLVGLGRLPLIRESSGPGYARIFHPDAVKIITEHMARRATSTPKDTVNNDY